MLLDDYLDYLYESKWKRMLAAGKLKASDLKRIKKGRLHKTQSQWTKGVEKGTAQKIRKAGGKTSGKYSKQVWFPPSKYIKDPMQAHTDVSTKTIHAVKKKHLKPKEKTLGAITKRHEADEFTISKKKGVGIRQRALSRKVKGVSHASDEVLRREKELSNITKGLYGKRSIEKLSKYRKGSKEYERIRPTKKKIKRAEKNLEGFRKRQQKRAVGRAVGRMEKEFTASRRAKK